MAEYRIDDLAQAAGTTTRNVRAYQEKGLLPTPTRRSGRALIYDETHLARLRIIDALLQRGFTIAHIADFITSWETGKDLTEILGLQSAVTATWGKSEEPMEIPRELVDTFFGDAGAQQVDEDQLARLEQLGLVRLHGDTVELTRPQVLEIFAGLSAYGFGLPGLIDLHGALLERLEEIARLMVVAAKDHIVAQHGPGWLPESDAEIAETTEMLNNFRELGTRSVHDALDQALDKALQAELGAYLETAARRHAPDGPQHPAAARGGSETA
ncbi:MerR family transcriptional regulator [Nocardia niigatensis]|uniref:MerR family transcriptional regulator n=1 Tax=Nocardia niigatensis TaxID=209249 RepID=UPI000313ECD1|nr:MerR family transcriptional regulator [Nocardia niigatensis]